MGAEGVEVQQAVGSEEDAPFFAFGVLVFAAGGKRSAGRKREGREDAPIVETYAVSMEDDALIGVEMCSESVDGCAEGYKFEHGAQLEALIELGTPGEGGDGGCESWSSRSACGAVVKELGRAPRVVLLRWKKVSGLAQLGER